MSASQPLGFLAFFSDSQIRASQDICSLTSPKTKCLLRSRLDFLRSVTS